MRYFDPSGRETNRVAWFRQYTDPANSSVQETETVTVMIRTSWIGLALDREYVPKLYMVEIRERIVKEGSWCYIPKGDPSWWNSEAEALEEHARMEKEFVSGLPKKDVKRRRRGGQG